MSEARCYSAPPLRTGAEPRSLLFIGSEIARVPGKWPSPCASLRSIPVSRSAPLRSHAFRTPLILMSSEDSTTGKGFRMLQLKSVDASS